MIRSSEIAAYELSHDAIAKLVFHKASTEARMRRKIERYIRERFQAYQERQVALTQDDLDFVWPYLDQVNNTKTELDFLRREKRRLQRKRQLWIILLSTIILAFACLAFWAHTQRKAAEMREQESQAMRVSLAARYALYEGNPRLAFYLAEQAIRWNRDANATVIAQEVFAEIQASPLVGSIHHEGAITALEFSSDSRFFLSASEDGEIRWSDLYRRPVHQHWCAEGVAWARLLPDEERVVVRTTTGLLGLWLIASNQLTLLDQKQAFAHCELSRDGNFLGAFTNEQVWVWDLRVPEGEPQSFGVGKTVSAIAFISNGRDQDVLIAGVDGSLSRRTLKGEMVTIFENLLDQPVTGFSIGPGADKLVFRTAGGDFMLAADGSLLPDPTARLFNAYVPTRSVFGSSKTPERLISINQEGNYVYVWNTGSSQSDIDYQWTPRGRAQFANLSRDGRSFVGATSENETFVLTLGDHSQEHDQVLFRFNNRVAWGAFAPNSQYFLSTSGNSEALLWKFDSQFVQNKMTLTEQELMDYYLLQGRLKPLSPQEWERYK